MNIEDINTILESTKKQKEDLDAKILKGQIDKVLLKNILENLRSVLDYLAIDIAASAQIKNNRIFFPYGRQENHFKLSVNKNLPNLKIKSIKFYEAIERIQPYKSKDSWLVDLCELTNEAKHNNLNKIEKNNTDGFQLGNAIEVKDVGKVNRGVFSNNYVNGVRMPDIEIENGKITKITGNFEKIVFTTTEIIRFHGKDIELTSFLAKVHNEISLFKEEIYGLL